MKKAIYKGEPVLTRGDYGEEIISGRADETGVFVWDSAYGWFFFGPISNDWEITEDVVDDVKADF